MPECTLPRIVPEPKWPKLHSQHLYYNTYVGQSQVAPPLIFSL